MSLLIYGADAIGLGRIIEFKATAQMSNDGIDYECTKFDVEFQGVVSLDLGLSPVPAAQALYTRLMVPRQSFTLFAGTTDTSGVILTSTAPDIMGGPKCNYVSFSQFAGSRTAIVNCGFTIYKHACTVVPGVLSNRWSVDSQIDQNQYTKRTITGELRVNPFRYINADDIREACFAAVPQGMQMISANFKEDTTGLKLSYSIVCQELYQLPPGKGTEFKCEYVETSENGAKTVGELYVDLAAPKTVTKAEMFRLVMQIVLSRFTFEGPVEGRDIFAGGSIREIMHDNRVSVVIRAIKSASQKAIGPVRVDRKVFGLPVPNAPVAGAGMQELKIYGNAGRTGGYAAVAAAWKGACAEGGKVNALKSGTTKLVGDDPTDGLSYQYGDLPEPQPDRISPGHRSKPYNFYDIQVTHHRKTGQVVAPKAKKEAKASGSEPRPRSVRIIRLTQPTTYRHIWYHCERNGQMPTKPKVTVRPGETLITHSFTVGSPKLGADGVTPIYYGIGHIVVQVHGNVDIDAEDIHIAKDPMTTYELIDDCTVHPGDFDAGLLEPPNP